jgi:hypothetical protein
LRLLTTLRNRMHAEGDKPTDADKPTEAAATGNA